MKKQTTQIQFWCERHGFIEREDVEFWCNRCDRSEIVERDGLYLCPACLGKKDPSISCAICGKPVKMIENKKSHYQTEMVRFN